MIAAVAGWRVVLADRENGGSVALPIVAWVAQETTTFLPAPGRESSAAGSERTITHRWLDCWYVPNELGVPPQRLGDNELMLGYLAPGVEHDAAWSEWGDEAIKRIDDEDERQYQRRIAGESLPSGETRP